MPRFTFQLVASVPTSGSKTYKFSVPVKVSDLIPDKYRYSNFNLFSSLYIPKQDETSQDGHVLSISNIQSPFTTGTHTLQYLSGQTTIDSSYDTSSYLVIGTTRPSLGLASGPYIIMSYNESECIPHTVKYPTTDTLNFQLLSLGGSFINSTVWITLTFEPILE